jgi:RNA polymerase sigma-70 factor (ECF subfamily)
MDEPLRLVVATQPGEAAAAGAASFEGFFLQERSELFRTLCLITRDRHEAEDLTQDAFVRVLERWDRVGEMNDPRGYLYRTAMNALRSRYRRAVAAAKRSVGMLRPDDAFAAIDERDATMRALATLSSRQRAAVVLIDLLGFPSKEAARMLGIRASTVRMHVSRAHAALKETMQDA